MLYIYILCIISFFAAEVLTSEFNLLDQDYYDLDKAEEIFEQFTRKYGKKYAERSDHHYEVFRKNLEDINKWNEERGMKMFGINQFSDLTFEEFSQSYLGFNSTNLSLGGIPYKPSKRSAPDNLDWRRYGYVTSVKSQRSCSSCFAFSAIANIEGQYAKKHNTRAFSLSVQQGFDCESNGTCSRGGVIPYVYQALAEQGGSMRDEDYPYENEKKTCRTQKDKIAVKVTGGNVLHVSNEDDLKEALASRGPLSVGVCVDEQFKKYNGGVYSSTNPCPIPNHAVLLVGYDNDGQEDYWIIKNSWNTLWGEKGYMRLLRGRKTNAIVTFVACSTVQ